MAGTQTTIQQLIQQLVPSGVNNGNPNTVYNTPGTPYNHGGGTPVPLPPMQDAQGNWFRNTVSPAANLGPMNLMALPPVDTGPGWMAPAGSLQAKLPTWPTPFGYNPGGLGGGSGGGTGGGGTPPVTQPPASIGGGGGAGEGPLGDYNNGGMGWWDTGPWTNPETPATNPNAPWDGSLMPDPNKPWVQQPWNGNLIGDGNGSPYGQALMSVFPNGFDPFGSGTQHELTKLMDAYQGLFGNGKAMFSNLPDYDVSWFDPKVATQLPEEQKQGFFSELGGKIKHVVSMVMDAALNGNLYDNATKTWKGGPEIAAGVLSTALGIPVDVLKKLMGIVDEAAQEQEGAQGTTGGGGFDAGFGAGNEAGSWYNGGLDSVWGSNWNSGGGYRDVSTVGPIENLGALDPNGGVGSNPVYDKYGNLVLPTKSK